MADMDALIRFIAYDIGLFILLFCLLFCLTALIKLIAVESKIKHPPEGLDELETVKWRIACMEKTLNSFPVCYLNDIANFFEKRRKRK